MAESDLQPCVHNLHVQYNKTYTILWLWYHHEVYSSLTLVQVYIKTSVAGKE